MMDIRDNSIRARILVVLAGICVLLAILSSYNWWSAYFILVEYSETGDYFSFLDTAEKLESQSLIVNWVSILVRTVLLVVFLTWAFRLASNLRNLGYNSMLHPVFSVLGWFIPLGNFVLPGMTTWSSNVGLDEQINKRHQGDGPPPGRTGNAMVILWWVITVLSLSIMFSGYSGAAEAKENSLITPDLEGFTTSAASVALGQTLAVLGFVFLLLVVRKMSEKEARLFALVRSQEWDDPVGGVHTATADTSQERPDWHRQESPDTEASPGHDPFAN